MNKEMHMFRNNNDDRWADTARTLADELPGADAELYEIIAESGEVDREVDAWLQRQSCQALRALENAHVRKAAGAPSDQRSSRPARREGDQAELMDLVLERIRHVARQRPSCQQERRANQLECPHSVNRMIRAGEKNTERRWKLPPYDGVISHGNRGRIG